MESKKIVLGDRIEYLNDQGQFHRLDGPAIEFNNGTRYWYIKDKLHREDGPAIEWNNGYKSWYLNGIKYSEQEWKEEVLKLKLMRIKKL